MMLPAMFPLLLGLHLQPESPPRARALAMALNDPVQILTSMAEAEAKLPDASRSPPSVETFRFDTPTSPAASPEQTSIQLARERAVARTVNARAGLDLRDIRLPVSLAAHALILDMCMRVMSHNAPRSGRNGGRPGVGRGAGA